jgi:hypothetical protein
VTSASAVMMLYDVEVVGGSWNVEALKVDLK